MRREGWRTGVHTSNRTKNRSDSRWIDKGIRMEWDGDTGMGLSEHCRVGEESLTPCPNQHTGGGMHELE